MVEAFSLGVGGELEEELLQPGTVRGPQLDEWDAGLVGHVTDSFGVGIRAQGPVAGVDHDTSARQGVCQPLGVSATDVGAGGGQQLGLGALCDDPAVADDDEVVGDDLDLVEEVRGQQHGGAPVCVVAEQVAHPANAGGVEPVGRFVEDQDGRLPEQGLRDTQSLPHAEGVVANAPPGLRLGEADQVEHLVHPPRGQAHGLLGQGEDLAARAATVLGGRVEQDPHLQARVGKVREPATPDVCRPGRGWGQADDDAHGGGLAGPVGSEEAGDPAGFGGEGDVVDGGVGAVPLGDCFDGDHRPSSIPAVTGAGLKPLTTR